MLALEDLKASPTDAVAQMFQVGGAEEFAAKGVGIKCRIKAADLFHDARYVLCSTKLCIGRGE
jgi:hypothetical protein